MRGRLTTVQTIGALVLLALATLVSIDLWNAALAQPCPSGPNCYPWGVEGPAAGVWSYASKTNYLARGSIQLTLLLVAGVFLAFKASGRQPANVFERLSFLGLVAAGMLFLV